MPARATVLLVAGALCLGACAGGDPNGRPAQSESRPAATQTGPVQGGLPPGAIPLTAPSFNLGTVLIDTSGGTVLVHVEVAQNPAQRSYGLMNRSSLAPDHGMVFLFFQETSAPFYMKDTRLPLSIAFFDGEGRILKILDMPPCRAEPCPVHHPGVTYSGALEVAQGSFARWGVSTGDRISLTQDGI